MLKKRELYECSKLYDLLIHPDVFPFVRQKPSSLEEFFFLTKRTIEEEERGETISRTILSEEGTPIGTINLFDIENGCGFLGTWIGKDYQGKGYNRIAKDSFFQELFICTDIHTIFLKIRKQNVRSIKAAEKLPYVVLADELYPAMYHHINKEEDTFHLYAIQKSEETLSILFNMMDLDKKEA